MASITFAIDEQLKSKLSKFVWVIWSEIVKQELLKREQLLERLHSKEEQELIKWSVELGRKAKKGRFKQVLSEVSPKIRQELLDSMSPEEMKRYG